MAGCGTSCRRLRGEGGIKIDPDCCGGCVVSIDPASIPPGPGGITEQRAKEIADAAAKAAVDGNNATHPPGINEDKAKQIAADAAKAAVDAYAANDPKGVSSDDAKKIADDAAKAAVDAYAAKDTQGLPEEKVKQIADDAAKAAIEQYMKDHPPVGGITEEQAKQIADDATKKHADTCHTLSVVKEGVTAEDGWSVHTQELRSIGGTRTAVIWLQRTGKNISGKSADQEAGDGQPEEGNIVPDLLIAKVAKDWIPPVTQLHSAHTGYTTGSVRINTKGELYLADLTSNNALRTGQFLVFEYEFQVKTACESGESTGPGPTPPDDGITEEQAKQIAADEAKAAIEQHMKDHPTGITEDKAKEIADAAAKKALDDHAAKTTDVHGIPDTASLETKDGAQAKADAAEKNALDSLRALVQKCLTLSILGEGVTAEDGWSVHTQELRSIGGTHNAVIWLKRTGDNISGKTADQEAGDGQPEEGNIVPDLLIAKVTKDWTPAKTILVSAHTGYTTGSVRINTKGELYLADLTSNNALRTGQYLVFTYTFLTEPDCAAAIKDPSGTPDASVKPDPQDPSGRTALLTITDSGGS